MGEKDYEWQGVHLNKPAVMFKDKDMTVRNVKWITTNILLQPIKGSIEKKKERKWEKSVLFLHNNDYFEEFGV